MCTCFKYMTTYRRHVSRDITVKSQFTVSISLKKHMYTYCNYICVFLINKYNNFLSFSHFLFLSNECWILFCMRSTLKRVRILHNIHTDSLHITYKLIDHDVVYFLVAHVVFKYFINLTNDSLFSGSIDN